VSHEASRLQSLLRKRNKVSAIISQHQLHKIGLTRQALPLLRLPFHVACQTVIL
jgi:hypothetical protein